MDDWDYPWKRPTTEWGWFLHDMAKFLVVLLPCCLAFALVSAGVRFALFDLLPHLVGWRP